MHKEGSRFDLPIAAAVLSAAGRLPGKALERTMVLGELHLDGRVEKITGILPSVLLAREKGCEACVIPAGNVREGRNVKGIRIIGVRSLRSWRITAGTEACRRKGIPGKRTREASGADGRSPGRSKEKRESENMEESRATVSPAVFRNIRWISGISGVRRLSSGRLSLRRPAFIIFCFPALRAPGNPWQPGECRRFFPP